MAKMKQTLEIDFESDGEDLEVCYRLSPSAKEIDKTNQRQQELFSLAMVACNEVYAWVKKEFQ